MDNLFLKQATAAEAKSEPLLAQTSPAFPPEIFDIILDHLHHYPQALRTCSLVSRAWVVSCRLHLFNHTSISLDPIALPCFTSLVASPFCTIASSLRSVSFGGFVPQVFDLVAHFAPRGLSLPSVSHLDLHSLSFEVAAHGLTPGDYPSLSPIFPNVCTLELRRTYIGCIAAFLEFVEFFPFLKKLTLDDAYLSPLAVKLEREVFPLGRSPFKRKLHVVIRDCNLRLGQWALSPTCPFISSSALSLNISDEVAQDYAELLSSFQRDCLSQLDFRFTRAVSRLHDFVTRMDFTSLPTLTSLTLGFPINETFPLDQMAEWTRILLSKLQDSNLQRLAIHLGSADQLTLGGKFLIPGEDDGKINSVINWPALNAMCRLPNFPSLSSVELGMHGSALQIHRLRNFAARGVEVRTVDPIERQRGVDVDANSRGSV
ncbi:hypothetical protein HGRIS_012087 [Hohenbuehelia grisea]|uniref:F-box domain-containing protein n=1 Tax=Hohenbuehelia grisea TaxID=104357 RepID=A0ABR3IR74_9AGAR